MGSYLSGMMSGSAGGDEASAEEIKSAIDQLITQERVVIYSKTTCPYCYEAKKVFDNLGQKYSTVELNKVPEGSQLQDVLKDMTGARTVPRVFVDGKCIGGGSDTVQLFKSGQLQEMLKNTSLAASSLSTL